MQPSIKLRLFFILIFVLIGCFLGFKIYQIHGWALGSAIGLIISLIGWIIALLDELINKKEDIEFDNK